MFDLKLPDFNKVLSGQFGIMALISRFQCISITLQKTILEQPYIGRLYFIFLSEMEQTRHTHADGCQ
jgi:hypothetical protein